MTIKSVFAGFGGQGVLLMGYILAFTGMRIGKHVTYLPSYGAEVRGGTANCTVVVSDQEIASPVASSPDFAVVMNNPSLIRFSTVVRTGGGLLLNDDLVRSPVKRSDLTVLRIPVNTLAHELGEDRSANVIMVGAFAEMSQVAPLDAFKEALADTGLGKKPKVLELNRKALEVGAEAARKAMQKEKSA
jgi:2-oxoglutarate ferredoxin oxidoreductase subunit gamma